uniref:Uncharacterized protein n=1 Tax=Meloidogyne incognita TaxID=6306 RepID=A0A914NIL1_MELIC
MPTTYHQRLILSRSKSLRNISDFSGVYLRPSMTKEERQHDYELQTWLTNDIPDSLLKLMMIGQKLLMQIYINSNFILFYLF